MIYKVYFSNGGTPATGLAPVIVWRKLDGSDAGTPPVVSEISAANAPGWYIFTADVADERVVTVDGTASLSIADRFVPMVVGPDDADERVNRVISHLTFDVRGNPTSGTLKVYATKAALDADGPLFAAPEATFAWTQTYDSGNRPLEYQQTKA